jgi:hypothetical protein
MTAENDRGTRREFMADVSRLATLAVLPTSLTSGASPQSERQAVAEWDLSWVERLATATDRAVFDWPTLGDPADPMVFQLAARYLDNCAAVYGSGSYQARVVLNIRTQAVPVALTDTMWERFSLGAEYNVKDPHTKQPAVRNPFWHRAPSPVPGYEVPTLEDFLERGSFFMVCDFALGHLARRLAAKAGRTADDVHKELLGGFVPGAYAVPSGMFGLVKAQNAGCAYMRV